MTHMTDHLLSISGLVLKKHGRTILDHIQLELPPGRILTILGPSGCGKTTLLRTIAGLEAPPSGTIRVNGQVLNEDGKQQPPQKRPLGMIFQTLALWPHLRVGQNIALGLRQLGLSRQARKEKTQDALHRMQLEGHASRYPNQLSVGEQQRVALARSLVLEPELLLLDEPFSHLDWSLRRNLIALIKSLDSGIVFVTHDQLDGLSMGQRLAIMDKGRIVQEGEQEEVIKNPATEFVRDFLSTLADLATIRAQSSQ